MFKGTFLQRLLDGTFLPWAAALAVVALVLWAVLAVEGGGFGVRIIHAPDAWYRFVESVRGG